MQLHLVVFLLLNTCIISYSILGYFSSIVQSCHCSSSLRLPALCWHILTNDWYRNDSKINRMAKACANFMGNACAIHVLQLVWGWAVMDFYQWSPQKAPGASQLYLKNVLYYRYHSAHMSGNVRYVEMITFHKRTWLVIYFFLGK